MNKPNVARLIKNTRRFVSKHSPEILTGIGVAGMITTTVLAVRATPRALKLLEKAECEKGEDLTAAETVKAAWKPYIPAVATGIASTACLIGANSVSARRTAALAAAYQMTESALSEYREKVIETVGEKKEQTIREKVNQEQINKHPVEKSDVIDTKKGNTLFMEPLSGRYFLSDIEKVRKAENALNKIVLHNIGGCVSLNEFYDELDIPRTDLGDSLGWNTDYLIDLDITPGITESEEPCLVLGHHNPPRYDY